MQKIEVFRRYEGNRMENPVDVGVYELDDPRVQGCAIYLRDNGNARFIEVEEQPKPKRIKRGKRQ